MGDAQVSLITGAGSGIGRATAVELARRGHSLALVARTEADLRETSERAGGKALVLPANVGDPEACRRVVERTCEHFGRIDAVVHAAGIAPVLSIGQITPAIWHDVVDVNLSAALFLSQAAWPVFERQGGGVIVNVSSFAARDPFSGFAAYGAAKAGVNLLGVALAREGAAHGIRVHTVAPAAVETKMFRQILSVEQFPADKTLQPEEVAAVIAQCIEGDLRHTSGEVIWMQKQA